jgi:TatD DNase family protein
LIDSHAHINAEEFRDDRILVIERTFQEGIKALLCPAELTEEKDLEIALDLVDTYPNIIAAAGVHPHNARNFNHDLAVTLQELTREKKIHAVGEIGLDFHYNLSSRKDQIQAFRTQLHLAQELDLPVVVHSRNAGKEIAAAIKEVHYTRGGVLHCFTEDWAFAKYLMDHHFWVSFSGILTYPNADSLREVAKKMPLDRILIETDSPYLVPVPYRGKIKRNEPLYVKEIAQMLAQIKHMQVEEIATITSQNFSSLFLFEISKLRC